MNWVGQLIERNTEDWQHSYASEVEMSRFPPSQGNTKPQWYENNPFLGQESLLFSSRSKSRNRVRGSRIDWSVQILHADNLGLQDSGSTLVWRVGVQFYNCRVNPWFQLPVEQFTCSSTNSVAELKRNQVKVNPCIFMYLRPSFLVGLSRLNVESHHNFLVLKL